MKLAMLNAAIEGAAQHGPPLIERRLSMFYPYKHLHHRAP